MHHIHLPVRTSSYLCEKPKSLQDSKSIVETQYVHLEKISYLLIEQVTVKGKSPELYRKFFAKVNFLNY